MGKTRDSLRRRLDRAQRLESLGRLSGEIADDLRAVLETVATSTEALQCDGDAARDAAIRADIDVIGQAAKRGRNMAEQLLLFSQQRSARSRPTRVDERLRSLRPLLERLLPDTVELELDLAAGDGCVRIDPEQLDRVVLNLVANARDAMPDGGALRVGSRPRWLVGADAVPGLEEARYVEISVADTGTGMTAAVQERLFEPFFTTKESGAGAGLGLSAAYGIAAGAGGDIAVSSRAGAGSTISVYLPHWESRRPA